VNYTAPHVGLLGEPAFDVNVPVFRGEEFLGTLVGVYSCRRLVRQMLHREILQNHRVSLVDDRGNAVVSLPAVERIDERLIDTVDLDPPGRGLRLRLARYGTGLWGMGIGLLTLLCVALVIGMAWGMWSLNRNIARRARAEESLRQARNELAERVRERTADLERANVQLQQEMADRRLAEEQARQRQDELAHVARVSTMGEMAAGLAHEINQPLGAIASFAEGGLRLIEAGSPDLERIGHAIGEVADQAKRAGRIIGRLRAFVAKGQPQRSDCNLRELTEEVADLIAMDIRQERIRFRLDMPPPLPAVSVDRVQIQQVLLNLMRNAVEAIAGVETGDRELVVRASGPTPSEGMVTVSVSDRGPLCLPTDLAKIFDAFYTTKTSGIGMGLSISRSIVSAHGGRTWATPNPGGGLTVWFTVPPAGGDCEEHDHANQQDNR
jgi:C4-dicarboxylate-specific signal transduction histidine kinase